MSKLVVKLDGRNGGSIVLRHDGLEVELKRVSDIHIGADGIVEVKMWTQDLEAELVISDRTAEAILRADKRE